MLNQETDTEDRLEELLAAVRTGQSAPAVIGPQILTETSKLMLSDTGVGTLYQNIETIAASGVFDGTSWEDPAHLVPSLVRGTLLGGYPFMQYEGLSELRMLKLALGDYKGQPYPKEAAVRFMQEAIIAAFDLAFDHGGEELRHKLSKSGQKRIRSLFRFILSRMPIETFKEKLVLEIIEVAAHRPIVTNRLQEMLGLVKANYQVDRDDPSDAELALYVDAAFHPTELARTAGDLGEYRSAIEGLNANALLEEASQMAASMYRTGLVSDRHAELLDLLVEREPGIAAHALALDEHGMAEFKRHRDLVIDLLRNYAVDGKLEVLYGMSCLLNRNLLSRPAVMNAFMKLLRSRLAPSVRSRICGDAVGEDQPNAEKLLVGGVIRLLGQPLGLGQGQNPTCQSARGLSMWSQHAPGKLLNLLVSAVVADQVEFRYQGEIIRSSVYSYDQGFDLELDPVSVVLVPLLDNIYKQMMEQAQRLFPLQDPHVTVNPAFYGLWIPTGFLSCYDASLDAIRDYQYFVRVFYSVFHPDHNSDFLLVYPLPVGIFITTSQGEFLGFHAISLLRFEKTDNGLTRCYFFNPNNDGRQDWGQGIKPTVMGNGERHGESSLPFEALLSRIYAFHFNTIETEPSARAGVPDSEVERVESLARESWGKRYKWI